MDRAEQPLFDRGWFFSFYYGLEQREFRSIIGKLTLPIVSFGIVAYVLRFRRITFSKT